MSEDDKQACSADEIAMIVDMACEYSHDIRQRLSSQHQVLVLISTLCADFVFELEESERQLWLQNFHEALTGLLKKMDDEMIEKQNSSS